MKYYGEYFKPHGLYENEVYNGVEKLLKDLKAKDKTIIVATSKPEEFAVELLKHFNLYQYFDFVGGASMDEKRVKKAEVIAYALEKCSVADLTSVVMIGDREHDVYGARQIGIDFIGVVYGYGDYEELQKAGADYIVATPEEILSVINDKE